MAAAPFESDPSQHRLRDARVQTKANPVGKDRQLTSFSIISTHDLTEEVTNAELVSDHPGSEKNWPEG
jgi:hypothetical protein